MMAQSNMLGSDFNHIYARINGDPEYSPKIDTINSNTIVLTCKGTEKYPYYTYEIDMENNECVCYGIVSKDRQVYDAYVDMLSTFGQLVEIDSARVNFTYSVKSCNENDPIYYSIKQPYYNSTMLSQRSIFYVLVTKNK